MNTTPLAEFIYRQVQKMPEADVLQIVKFIQFLQFAKAHPDEPKSARKGQAEAIERLFGSYARSLSSSEDFARRKQDELAQEEAKWQRQ